ncbi:MAG: hypothetical protein IPI00_12715 [Flavobacteriales bacterium]|nr:hypothetical protein [Flavobacteriales bacterium]MBP9139625.1 hypothetical protein [Flavobacteriales bacterium]HQV53327.1 hypothetical protein [Flavobacteriales bacterium]HQX31449.1 hypothetical protein [Flavobacteriales bacterium]HQX39530.1 hypothetical protein [Flavobacteriales bacterium]
MRTTRPFLSTLILLFAAPSFAQGDIRDTTIALTSVTASYAYQIPSGDMALRFGNNSNIGINAFYKNKRNYFFGAEGSFLFGNKVVESGLLRNVINSEGQFVDADGVQADVLIYERGWTAMGIVGKIIPVVGPNPNSGILLKFGIGYLRHKIRVQTQKNVVPQLEGEYLEGYDRLAAGPMGSLLVGYQHFGNRRFVNFMIGFEVIAAFTQSLRAFNFDTEQAETGTRNDGLTGLRVGWSLPIYKRSDDRYHYY